MNEIEALVLTYLGIGVFYACHCIVNSEREAGPGDLLGTLLVGTGIMIWWWLVMIHNAIHAIRSGGRRDG